MLYGFVQLPVHLKWRLEHVLADSEVHVIFLVG
jgi:hypothetical protein